MKSTDLILERIDKIGEGKIFTYSDLFLPRDKQAATAMALSRMVAENKLKKAGKGKFYKPACSRLGEMAPLVEEMTKDFLYKDGKIIGYITGVAAFALMGLTTQISSKVLIGSNFYRRPLARGNYEISFTLQKNEITGENIPLLRFLDAIRFIKKIPASTPDTTIKILRSMLTTFSSKEIESLTQLATLYPASTKALLGAMLDSFGYESCKLRVDINPFTKFNIGISADTLPNKSSWNIL